MTSLLVPVAALPLVGVAGGKPAEPAPALKHHAPAEVAAVIRPSDPTLGLSKLAPFDQNWVILLPQPDGTEKRGITMHDTLRPLEDGLWEYRSEMDFNGREMFYETVFDGRTLASVRHRQSDPMGLIEVAFEENRIHGTIKGPEGEEPRALEIAIDGPLFESGLAPVVFGCLPLEPGYTASIPSVDFHEAETGWLSIEVHEQVSVSPDQGFAARAYKIAVDQLGDTASVRWITTSPAGRVWFEFGQGGGGHWQLLAPDAANESTGDSAGVSRQDARARWRTPGPGWSG